MNTKLTLTLEDTIIIKAKEYAKNKNRSLSDLISSYLKIITDEDNKSDITISPKVKSLQGSFNAPKNFDYKKELAKELSKKYV
jgi:hypothetical protein